MLSLQHSSIFKASFAGEMVEAKLMADQGTNVNFISEALLEAIVETEPSMVPVKLRPSQVYRNITGDPCHTCHQVVKLDVYLHTRHGTSLILHNIIWKVSKEELRTPIIGRRVLESLGCDNREMLMVARDKLGEDIDVNMR